VNLATAFVEHPRNMSCDLLSFRGRLGRVTFIAGTDEDARMDLRKSTGGAEKNGRRTANVIQIEKPA
jgi:hypothetical protein